MDVHEHRLRRVPRFLLCVRHVRPGKAVAILSPTSSRTSSTRSSRRRRGTSSSSSTGPRTCAPGRRCALRPGLRPAPRMDDRGPARRACAPGGPLRCGGSQEGFTMASHSTFGDFSARSFLALCLAENDRRVAPLRPEARVPRARCTSGPPRSEGSPPRLPCLQGGQRRPETGRLNASRTPRRSPMPPLKTLFLNPPSYEGFDGGAGSRYQARREIRSFWYPTWLAQPAALVPGSRLVDAPGARPALEDVLPLAGDYELAVLHTSTPSFRSDVEGRRGAEGEQPEAPDRLRRGARRRLAGGIARAPREAIDFVARNEFDFTILEVAAGPAARRRSTGCRFRRGGASCTTGSGRRSRTWTCCPS